MKRVLIIENEFQSIKAPIMVLEGKYKQEQDALEYKVYHYCPRNSFNISKSNKLIVTHQN